MSDLNLTVQEGSDIYLSITETPAVVTLSQAVISGAMASTVTGANTVTVALDANSLAALESVTVTVGNVTIGSSISISNFPASQQVSGTVTASLGGSEFGNGSVVFGVSGADVNAVRSVIFSSANGDFGSDAGAPVDSTNPLPVSVKDIPAVSGTVTVGSCVTHGVTIANSSVTVNGTFWQATQPVSLASVPTHGVTLASTTVTVSSLPTISGTVTASLSAFKNQQTGSFFLNSLGTSSNIDCLGYSWMFLTADGLNSGTWERIVQWSNDNTNWNQTNGSPVYYWDGSNWAISNSLQIQLDTNYSPKTGNTMYAIPVIGRYFRITSSSQGEQDSVTYRYLLTNSAYVPYVAGSIAVNSCVTHGVTIANSVTIGSLPVQLSTTTIGGTARLNVTLSSATTVGATVPSYGNLYGGSDGTNFRAINVDSSGRTVVTGSVSVANLPSTQTVAGTVTANISGTVPVSGTFWQATQPVSLASLPASTVTVGAMPSGALTTRFGSVTTANTAQLTTAVTNASRKYLLCQNIDSSSVTIGIGFSPTTTQGVQLAAGAGLTFDAFCPTGAVWWLSGVTGANICILEG